MNQDVSKYVYFIARNIYSKGKHFTIKSQLVFVYCNFDVTYFELFKQKENTSQFIIFLCDWVINVIIGLQFHMNNIINKL